jgi:hypothetical protein
MVDGSVLFASKRHNTANYHQVAKGLELGCRGAKIADISIAY